MLSKFSRISICFALGLACSAYAQSSSLSVRGSVVDTTGAGVTGATIRLESSAGDAVAQTKADQDGNFALLRFTPGSRPA